MWYACAHWDGMYAKHVLALLGCFQQESLSAGSTCTFDDAVPSKGGALLQHLTTRSNPTEAKQSSTMDIAQLVRELCDFLLF